MAPALKNRGKVPKLRFGEDNVDLDLEYDGFLLAAAALHKKPVEEVLSHCVDHGIDLANWSAKSDYAWDAS